MGMRDLSYIIAGVIEIRLSKGKKRGLDDPVKAGPLLQGVEAAVRDFMAGTVAPGMFF
jgi:hypothetical protein